MAMLALDSPALWGGVGSMAGKHNARACSNAAAPGRPVGSAADPGLSSPIRDCPAIAGLADDPSVPHPEHGIAMVIAVD
jgi:hypothetical protein